MGPGKKLDPGISRPQAGQPRTGPWTVIAVSVLFGALWIAMGATVIDTARRHDFLNLYTGASLAAQGRFQDLHDAQAQLQRERELVPSTAELVPFVRPAFYALLLAPLAFLPYHIAFWV